jgi:hypothetical protein
MAGAPNTNGEVDGSDAVPGTAQAKKAGLS